MENNKNKLIEIIDHFSMNLMNNRTACDEFALEYDEETEQYYLGIYIYTDEYEEELIFVKNKIGSARNSTNNIFYINLNRNYKDQIDIYNILFEIHLLGESQNRNENIPVIFLKREQIDKYKKEKNTKLSLDEKIAAGFSISSNLNKDKSTLGGIFYNPNGEKFALTCAHAMGESHELGNQDNHPVFAFSPLYPYHRIGVLCWYEDTFHDIALIKLFKGINTSDDFRFENSPKFERKLSSSYCPGEKIKFCGYKSRGNKFSKGTIESIYCSKRVFRGSNKIIDNSQRIVSRDAKFGDSGAIVFNSALTKMYGIIYEKYFVGNKGYFKTLNILKTRNINLNLDDMSKQVTTKKPVTTAIEEIPEVFYYDFDLKIDDKTAFQYVFAGNFFGSTYTLMARLDYIEEDNEIKATFHSNNIGGNFKFGIIHVDDTTETKPGGVYEIQIFLDPLTSTDKNNTVCLKLDKKYVHKESSFNISIPNDNILNIDPSNVHNFSKKSNDDRSCDIRPKPKPGP